MDYLVELKYKQGDRVSGQGHISGWSRGLGCGRVRVVSQVRVSGRGRGWILGRRRVVSRVEVGSQVGVLVSGLDSGVNAKSGWVSGRSQDRAGVKVSGLGSVSSLRWGPDLESGSGLGLESGSGSQVEVKLGSG
ncbi:hypothetical protein KY285_029933 [Solanum tuberosum]|nr:hypothetical protein KY285_029933 [Solanum tuberosum]